MATKKSIQREPAPKTASSDGQEGYSDADVRSAVMSVIYGHDPEAAERLIKYFHQQFEAGELFDSGEKSPVEMALLEYVAHVFKRLAVGKKSGDVALGLTLGRGEYEREDTTQRDVEIAAFVVLSMRRNWTWIDAKGEAANVFFKDGAGDGAVDVAYKKYKDGVVHLSCIELELFLSGKVIKHR